jgi:hypothetical protein
VIQHIVLFNLKAALSDVDLRSYARTSLALLAGSPQVARFTLGKHVSVDPGYSRDFGDKTYEYAAVLEFKDTNDLVGYLTSRDHGELGRL